MQASNTKINVEETKKFIEEKFNNSILPALEDYIRIPNLSRAFDPN
jgi:hypothetical protein